MPDVHRADDIAEVAPNLAPPPGNPRFPLFDSLRAVAALSVFLGHTITVTYLYWLPGNPQLVQMASEVAYEGVAIFFLISGFLLYRPFLSARRAGRKLSLRGYARRRFLRIVPAYWMALTVFILAGLISGVTAGNWWIFYGFGQIYSIATIGHGIGVAWTLCIEITFYAALPIFAFAAAKLAGRRRSFRGDIALLSALAMASLLFRAHFNAFSEFATVSTLAGTFFWFALGMGLAIASVSDASRTGGSPVARLVTQQPTVFWVAAVAGLVLLHEVARSGSSVASNLSVHVLYGLVALLVLLPGVFGDEAGGLVRRVLRVRALAWLGLVSYGFYLYHTIVIAQVAKMVAGDTLPQRYLLVLIGSFAISCACAAASYYLLERPVMRLKRWPRSVHPWSRPRSGHPATEQSESS